MAVETYEQVPYQSKPYRYATPARMAVIAHLFAMAPADPRTARVLEIGCAGGGNLIPRALVNPAAEYLGIDPAGSHVHQAHEAIAALGVENVRVEQRGVESLGEADGTFDYIVAHGVYSWVPAPVREALLAACRDRLRPNGVAYVSYNTFPGWHQRAMVRDAMLFHTADLTDATSRIQQARAMLQFLASSTPDHGGSWQRLLAHEQQLLDQMGDDYLFHDHLSPENDPVYVHQFIDAARSVGLAFLGEAEFARMMTVGLPSEVQETLHKLGGDLAREQQYLDFVVNRTFRHTLLVHGETALKRDIDWTRAQALWASSTLTFEGDLDLSPEAVVTFTGPTGQELTTRAPALKAGWLAFMQAGRQPLSFDDWVEEVRSILSQAGLDPSQATPAELGKSLLYAYAQGLVDLWPHPIPMGGDRVERPQSFAMARLQAASGAPWVTSRRHEVLELDPYDRFLITACDGTRDRALLRAGLTALVEAGQLIMEEDGVDVETGQALAAALAELEGRLATLGARGLLLPVAA